MRSAPIAGARTRASVACPVRTRVRLVAGVDRVELRLDGHGFAVSALKAAEDDDGLVLRAHNPGSEPASLVVQITSGEVVRCRMDETGEEPVDGPIVLRPCEVATLRIRPERPG